MFFGKALLTRMFLYAGRAILRFTACVNKKAGECRRRMHFTLKIHDFWKLQSRDIHSQRKPLILYNHDFWKLRSCDIHSQMKPLILYNHDFWKLQSCDIHSQMKPLILYNHDFWKHRLVIDAIE